MTETRPPILLPACPPLIAYREQVFALVCECWTREQAHEVARNTPDPDEDPTTAKILIIPAEAAPAFRVYARQSSRWIGTEDRAEELLPSAYRLQEVVE